MLRDWVAIESDSSNVQKRPELHRMMETVAQKLQLMGGTVQLVDIGEQEVSERTTYLCNITPPCSLEVLVDIGALYLIVSVIGW